MEAVYAIAAPVAFVVLAFFAWRRYLWAAKALPETRTDESEFGLTDVFGDRSLINVPHQKGIRWLTDVFSRSAKKFPDHIALQIPYTGESLTYSELDTHAERIAASIAPFLSGPDQVVAVAMPQDNWQIVASHLGVLKAGGTLMFLDRSLPDPLITHMLNDAEPALILTRGEARFRDLPTLDVLALPETPPKSVPPHWLDDPAQRLATIFYTSGTTGMPKGVECPHAGYVNLALSYADYFDLMPGMDATTLTSSLGYDGSISEMYSAWVSGCAVVMLTSDQVRSGPDLVPILRDAEVTVLFCPPVLLTTLTSAPEIDLPYPICRYIVPAGEAFPTALVEPWTRARRQIINTYGPTEASTDTSRQSLHPGEPITIGSPFPNVTYVILDVAGSDPLPHGETGELCIGGVHVARGYRNLPEQTAHKFITHPKFGRLYRTGDKCRIDIKTQRVHFFGRIDAQLKVRGHRVEAQAVEDILQNQFPEIEAAVLDYQNETLVAFISAPSVSKEKISVVSPAPSDWAAGVLASLAEQLPGPSVPTSIFLIEKFVLKPVSGKIDRTCLPDLNQLLRSLETQKTSDIGIRSAATSNANIEAMPDAAKPDEPDVDEALSICRSVFETPIGLDDEFADAGGHSIVIARLTQKLQAAGFAVSVRDLLSTHNTPRLVAQLPRVSRANAETPETPLKSNENFVERDEAAAEVLSVGYFTALQTLFALLLYSPGVVALVIVLGATDVDLIFESSGLFGFIIAGAFLYLAALAVPFAALIWVKMIKSFISGDNYKNNVTPGVYPKWSRMHLRVWCIRRMESLVLAPLSALYRSTSLTAFVMRQLGATVGKNVQFAPNVGLSGPLDLISIGDDVAIQTGAQIYPTGWSGQNLIIGPVRLENGCKIGMRSTISNNVTVGSGSWITPFTSILSDVGSQEMWEGAPASLAGRYTELNRTADACRHSSPAWMLEALNILMQVVISFGLAVVPGSAILWSARGLAIATEYDPANTYLKTATMFEISWHLSIYAIVTTWATIVITSVLVCLFIRFTPAPPGIYSSSGLRGALLVYRMFLLNRIQRVWSWSITGQYLRSLAGLHFSVVGASECDQMYNLVPEAASADGQVFWSNGCFTNMLDVGAGHFTLRRLDMPSNFFSGNNCVAEYGNLPSNFLLGVSTPASDIRYRRQMRSRPGDAITIVGNPPVRFASSSFEAEDDAHKLPGFPIFLARVFLHDFLTIVMVPVALGLIFTILYISLSRWGTDPTLVALVTFVLSEVVLVLLCILAKKFLVGGRWGIDDSTPFWSLRHFLYFLAQDCYFIWCGSFMAFFSGSILPNPILRRLGCRIGRRTILTSPMQCFDWNAISIGDDCVVDGMLQLHTFEDMVLKVKRTDIGDGSTVNFGATIMGGADIGKESTLLPLSLVLKEMELPTAQYEGSPSQLAVGHPVPTPKPTTTVAKTEPHTVDNTDWLKTAAIILVIIDHFGYFFMENDLWWGVFGRFAAPTFFFLVGYATSRGVPLHWIGLGVGLTLLDSWNADWEWVAPNILLSFAIIRIAQPYVLAIVRRRPWIAFAVLLAVLLALLPFAAKMVDYGIEGWLWALVGLYHRLYVDGKAATEVGTASQAVAQDADPVSKQAGAVRLFVCLAAAVIYVWQEQIEFSFPQTHLIVLIIGLCLLSLSFLAFFRGPSRFQPPSVIAGVMGFAGRHTLEIYAVQLAVSEIIVKLLPNLAG